MRLRLGTVILCAAVGLGRAMWLAAQLSGRDAETIGYLLFADLPVLGVLCLLAFAEAKLPRPWRAAPLVLSVALVAVWWLGRKQQYGNDQLESA